MLEFTYFAAAAAFIAMAVVSFVMRRTDRLAAGFWWELLSVIPAVIALATAAANDGSGWVIGLWAFNGACAVGAAFFMSKQIQYQAEIDALNDKYRA